MVAKSKVLRYMMHKTYEKHGQSKSLHRSVVLSNTQRLLYRKMQVALRLEIEQLNQRLRQNREEYNRHLRQNSAEYNKSVRQNSEEPNKCPRQNREEHNKSPRQNREEHNKSPSKATNKSLWHRSLWIWLSGRRTCPVIQWATTTNIWKGQTLIYGDSLGEHQFNVIQFTERAFIRSSYVTGEPSCSPAISLVSRARCCSPAISLLKSNITIGTCSSPAIWNKNVKSTSVKLLLG